jgi:hypothetical protein
MKIRAFPENKLIKPRNSQDLGFVKDFEDMESEVALDTNTIVLVNSDRKRVLKWINEEMGRFENAPAEITSNSGFKYPYYLNFSGIKGSDYECTVGIESRKGMTHFFDRAKGTTFELLRTKGFLPDSLMVEVPYVEVPDQLVLQAFVTGLTIAGLTIQLISWFKAVADLAAAGLDVVGTGILTAIAQAIAFIIWVGLIVLAILQAAINGRELVFPEIRFLKSISDYNLLNAGCAYLGYELQSTFLESIKHIHTLPVPESQPDGSIFKYLPNNRQQYFNRGYPTALDSTPDLWSLFLHYIEGYNQKILVNEGIVRLESESTLLDIADVKVKRTWTNQDQRANEWEYNDEDVFGRKYIHWQIDFSDSHSPDNAEGIKAEYITEPINVLNPDLFNCTNLKEIVLDFAWMARKNSLTKFEELVKGLLEVCDAVVSAFGGSSNLAAGVDDRIGIGMISSQYFGKTKKLSLLMDGSGKQRPSFADDLSADNIYVTYHQQNQVREYCQKKFEMTVPFTDRNFNKLLLNYFVILDDGQKAKVRFVNWKDEQHKAILKLSVPDNSGFNVKTTKLA